MDADTAGLDRYVSGTGFSAKEIIRKILANELELDGNTIWENILELFLNGLKEFLPLLASLLAVAIICSCVGRAELFSGSCRKFALLGGKLAFVITLFGIVFSMISVVRDVIEEANECLFALTPILLTLLASCGVTGTAGLVTPVQTAITSLMSGVITALVLPAVTAASVTQMVGSLTEDGRLDAVTAFFKSAAGWCLGVLFTAFTGVVAISGLSAAVSDGVSIRSVKYALSSGVPVIGGAVSDSVSVLLSSSVLLKSAVGICGMIAIALILAAPVITAACRCLALKALSAICGTFADSCFTKCLQGAGDCMKLLTVTLAGYTVIVFVFLGIVAGAGSAML